MSHGDPSTAAEEERIMASASRQPRDGEPDRGSDRRGPDSATGSQAGKFEGAERWALGKGGSGKPDCGCQCRNGNQEFAPVDRVWSMIGTGLHGDTRHFVPHFRRIVDHPMPPRIVWPIITTIDEMAPPYLQRGALR
jgi:hypothetical protein